MRLDQGRIGPRAELGLVGQGQVSRDHQAVPGRVFDQAGVAQGGLVDPGHGLAEQLQLGAIREQVVLARIPGPRLLGDDVAQIVRQALDFHGGAVGRLQGRGDAGAGIDPVDSPGFDPQRTLQPGVDRSQLVVDPIDRRLFALVGEAEHAAVIRLPVRMDDALGVEDLVGEGGFEQLSRADVVFVDAVVVAAVGCLYVDDVRIGGEGDDLGDRAILGV